MPKITCLAGMNLRLGAGCKNPVSKFGDTCFNCKKMSSRPCSKPDTACATAQDFQKLEQGRDWHPTC